MKKTKITLKTIKALTAAILLLNATTIANNKLTTVQASKINVEKPEVKKQINISKQKTQKLDEATKWDNIHRNETEDTNKKELGILLTIRRYNHDAYISFLYARKLGLQLTVDDDQKVQSAVENELNKDLDNPQETINKYPDADVQKLVQQNPWLFANAATEGTPYEKLKEPEYQAIKGLFDENFTQQQQKFQTAMEQIQEGEGRDAAIKALQKIEEELYKLPDWLYSQQEDDRNSMATELAVRLTAITAALSTLEKEQEVNPQESESGGTNVNNLIKSLKSASVGQATIAFNQKNKLDEIDKQLAEIKEQLAQQSEKNAEQPKVQERLRQIILQSNKLNTILTDKLKQRADQQEYLTQTLIDTITAINTAINKIGCTISEKDAIMLLDALDKSDKGAKTIKDQAKQYEKDVEQLKQKIADLENELTPSTNTHLFSDFNIK